MELGGKEIGMAMTILKNSAETNGKSFEMKWEVFSGPGSPPIHIHPYAIETYEILEGEMELYINGNWINARKGDKLQVEKGQPHTFRNNSGASAFVYNTHQPAMNFEGFFRGLDDFSKSGLIKDDKMSFKAVLGIARLYTRYNKEIVSVKPPAFLFRLFSLMGKVMGINYKRDETAPKLNVQ